MTPDELDISLRRLIKFGAPKVSWPKTKLDFNLVNHLLMTFREI